MISFSAAQRFSLVSASSVRRGFSSNLNIYPRLSVHVRSTGLTGSRKSRELRSQNLVPGVLYGVDDDRNVLKTMVTMDSKLLMKEIEQRGSSFENTVYELLLETDNGTTKHLVTPRQTQFSSCKLPLFLCSM
jgi:ribosomal protein L25 (general stress protein Ctc)